MVQPKEEEKTMPTPILEEVQDFLGMFKDIISDWTPTTLPLKRDTSHQIDFIPGASFPNKATYKLTLEKNQQVARQVQDLLDQGLIKKSISPCVVPVLFASKKGGKWRLCTDCRDINMIKIRYRFPVPMIENLMDCIGGSRHFTKLDLQSCYHQIRIQEIDEWKTTFETTTRLYELRVMQFELINSSSTFISLMNELLMDYIDRFVLV